MAWNSNTICPEGRRLLDDADRNAYQVLGPEVPTHYPYCVAHTPDVIDLAVTRNIDAAVNLDVLDDHLISDHQPVCLTLDDIPQTFLLPPRSLQDWRVFAKHMADFSPSFPVETPEDVEQLTTDLNAALQTALRDSKLDATKLRKPFQLPAHILLLIERKRKLRRQWQSTRCPTIKSQLNALAAKISVALATNASESWQRTIERASDDWSGIHRLCRQLSGKPAPIRPLLAGDGTPRYRAEDRAEMFADFLEAQFRPNPACNMQHVAEVERKLDLYFTQPIAPTEDPIVFSPGQIQRMIRQMPLRKAPGPDRVTSEALRHLPPRAIATLTRLFNGILRTGHFPTSWRLGRVIMLPKPGKNILLPGSYRPITLLSSTSKLFEKLLLLHMTPYLQPRDEQFGFRPEHSTTHQLARILHDIAVARNKRERVVAVFLDMEKAFDRVWHSGLLYKLSTSATPRRVVKIVATFLQDRRFQVAVESAVSTERPICAGVPQGSCLSPVCYSWYTDDIPVTDGVKLALYADDTAYITTSQSGTNAVAKMQHTLDALPSWLEDWRLTVNVAKTQAISIGSITLPQLKLMGQNIEWSATVKYLGVTIDRTLSMKPHVNNVIAQVRAARSLLRPVLSSRLPLRAKLGVYKTYIRTRLTYSAPAWFALVSETNRSRLRAQQSLTLRTLANAPRFVRNRTISRDLGVETLDDFVRRLSSNIFVRADGSQARHLRELAPYHRRPPDRHGLPRDLASVVNPT